MVRKVTKLIEEFHVHEVPYDVLSLPNITVIRGTLVGVDSASKV